MPPNDPNSRALRRGRVSEPGRIYLVTTTTHERRPCFLDHDVARIAAALSHAAVTWGSSRCLAWVVMPDHWHGLIELGDEPLCRAISRFKSRVTRETTQPLWQRGFHDCALRRHCDLRRAARYLIANPVRAGLAESVMDYPYWNAIWM